jgi:hypothetical protein
MSTAMISVNQCHGTCILNGTVYMVRTVRGVATRGNCVHLRTVRGVAARGNCVHLRTVSGVAARGNCVHTQNSTWGGGQGKLLSYFTTYDAGVGE